MSHRGITCEINEAAEPDRASRQRTKPHASNQAPPVWRAPEGPEGTGGLRGAAPNEVRPPSLAGGRALRRPEHQRGHKQHKHVSGPPRGLRGQAAVPVGGGRAWPGNTQTPRSIGGRHEACGARLRRLWAAAGPGRATYRHLDRLEAAARPAGPGRASRRRAERSSRRERLAGGQAARRPEICRGHKQHEAARPHRGPGGSPIRPPGGSQRFQRICVPAEPRRWQASTTRAAMPASADLPHVRGSYCFFTPTSPSILRTPS